MANNAEEVKVVKTIPYDDLLKRVETKYSTPRKQIEETMNQVTEVLGETLRDCRPSKVGECIQIETPFALVRVIKVPQKQCTDLKTNEKYTREECMVLSMLPAIKLINQANQGEDYGNEHI